jgi:2Fe-2S ferredoxin
VRTITFVEHSGVRHTVPCSSGLSVMEVARRNSVPGIDADCGEGCACATCDVYVDERWSERVGPPNATEASMLEFVREPRTTSRLSCQITVRDDFDGLLLTLPVHQGM